MSTSCKSLTLPPHWILVHIRIRGLIFENCLNSTESKCGEEYRTGLTINRAFALIIVHNGLITGRHRETFTWGNKFPILISKC
jgi:hypothetical protein